MKYAKASLAALSLLYILHLIVSVVLIIYGLQNDFNAFFASRDIMVYTVAVFWLILLLVLVVAFDNKTIGRNTTFVAVFILLIHNSIFSYEMYTAQDSLGFLISKGFLQVLFYMTFLMAMIKTYTTKETIKAAIVLAVIVILEAMVYFLTITPGYDMTKFVFLISSLFFLAKMTAQVLLLIAAYRGNKLKRLNEELKNKKDLEERVNPFSEEDDN